MFQTPTPIVCSLMTVAFLSLAPLGTLAFADVSQPTLSLSTSVFSDPSFKPAVETVVENYLLTHPEILVRVSQALEKKRFEAQQTQALQAMVESAQDLFKDPLSPVHGPTTAKYVLVEFFDYQCGYCKHMKPIMDSLLKTNPELKIIYKPLPVFGESSQWAALAALAAYQQDKSKFFNFHASLLAEKETLSKEKVMVLAQQAYLNVKQLEQDMHSARIKNALDANIDLGTRLMGMNVVTPVFALAALDPEHAFTAKSKRAFVVGGVPQPRLQKELYGLKQQ